MLLFRNSSNSQEPSSSIHIPYIQYLSTSLVLSEIVQTFCCTLSRCEKPLQCERVRGPRLLGYSGERRGVPAGQVWPRSQDQAADCRAVADPDLCVPAAEIQLHS